MRITELAEHVGVPTSTVRYYERICLLPPPRRTASGYRDYDEADATRLLFVSRARRMGLRCDQIAELLPAWDMAECGPTQSAVEQLIVEKQSEIATQISDLRLLAEQLEAVRAGLASTPSSDTCCSDLSCCMPEAGTHPVVVDIADGRAERSPAG